MCVCVCFCIDKSVHNLGNELNDVIWNLIVLLSTHNDTTTIHNKITNI